VGTVPPSRILSGLTPQTSCTADSRALKYGEVREASHHEAEWVTVIWMISADTSEEREVLTSKLLGDPSESNVSRQNVLSDSTMSLRS
jgi:hypothetical protein